MTHSEGNYLKRCLAVVLISALLTLCLDSEPVAAADSRSASDVEPRIDQDGTVHTRDYDIPLSNYMSAQAKQWWVAQLHQPKCSAMDAPISKIRECNEKVRKSAADQALAVYPVNIESRMIGGVRTRVITPKAGVAPSNGSRVLISLHGGGLMMGAGALALLESVPIAAVARIKVVSVDYRLAPEFTFPAASEDVTAVYKELLKDHQAADIGIYGCSGGGDLTAMSTAWLQKQHLPTPGAIGIFGSSLLPDDGGDSPYWVSLMDGDRGTGRDPRASWPVPPGVDYLSGVDLTDPLVAPGLHPEVLAKFPPTLLLASTRTPEVSALIQAQRLLTNAGVRADLHLWDGLHHCFFTENVDIPESKEAYAVIARFFAENLGRPRP